MNERSMNPAGSVANAVTAAKESGVAAGAKNLMNDVTDEVKDKTASARSAIADSYAAAKDTAAEAGAALAKKGDAAMKATSGFVQANPWLAVFAAAGVGIALGTLMRNRR